MKIRNGFVSNSSSSSFMISLEDIDEYQILMTKKHSEIAKIVGGYDYEDGDAWDIEEEGGNLIGKTNMDCFDMWHFLKFIVRVPDNIIKWRRYENTPWIRK